jgi:SAM-dependent methyltransferase
MAADCRSLVRTTYDHLAVEYAKHLNDELEGKPMDRLLLDRFADRMRGVGPVCELGCGPGHVAAYLHERGVDVSGIDLSAAMVEQARRLHREISFRCADMLALDVEDGAYAGVVSFYAIVHLAPEELSAAFLELRRMLRPGGAALLAFHMGDEVLRPSDLWGIPVSLAWVLFRTDDVVRCLTAAGLAIIETVEREPYPGVEHPSRRAYVLAERPA